MLRRFCVISGGPGTGKTHTVVRILALLVEQALRGGGTRAAVHAAGADRQGRGAPDRVDPRRQG